MSRPMATPARMVPAAAIGLAIVLAAGACKRGSDASAAVNQSDASSSAMASDGSSAMPTLPARSDPCGWVPAESVAAVMGKLAGPPRRGLHHDDPEPDDKGFACVYTLAVSTPYGQPNTVTTELRIDDAMSHEGGFRVGGALAEQVATSLNNGVPVANDTMALHPNGWDFVDALPKEFLGRVGHLGIFVNVPEDVRLDMDKAERLAALIRNHVPDRPFAAEEGQDADGDPCKLITRAEAEAVLGKLKYAPYRSLDETPLATSGGKGCSFYVGDHRVYSIKPEWNMGKQLFGVTSSTSQFFGTAIPGMSQEAADTLEGSWDQAAASVDGTLHFLKGDKMLTVTYRTSNATLPQALKLATVALKRL